MSEGTLQERLRRLLVIVPAARRPEGVPLEELAALLGCSADALARDVATLAFVGPPPFSPGDLIEIEVRNGRVHVALPQVFDRPARLSATEAAALAAAARALAGSDPTVGRAVEKLERAVSPAQRSFYERLLQSVAPEAPSEARGVAEVLERAARERREVEILYFSRSDLSPAPRLVRPRCLASAEGATYLSAQNTAGGERLYRLDRVARATLTNARFSPLPGLDVGSAVQRALRLRESGELPRARVRFTAEVAEAALGRHAGAVRLAGGGVEAWLAYATVPWLVAEVLSWGGEAEIMEPPEAREALRAAVTTALAAHAGGEELES